MAVHNLLNTKYIIYSKTMWKGGNGNTYFCNVPLNLKLFQNENLGKIFLGRPYGDQSCKPQSVRD